MPIVSQRDMHRSLLPIYSPALSRATEIQHFKNESQQLPNPTEREFQNLPKEMGKGRVPEVLVLYRKALH